MRIKGKNSRGIKYTDAEGICWSVLYANLCSGVVVLLLDNYYETDLVLISSANGPVWARRRRGRCPSLGAATRGRKCRRSFHRNATSSSAGGCGIADEWRRPHHRPPPPPRRNKKEKRRRPDAGRPLKRPARGSRWTGKCWPSTWSGTTNQRSDCANCHCRQRSMSSCNRRPPPLLPPHRPNSPD